jgi:hypothetical protein
MTPNRPAPHLPSLALGADSTLGASLREAAETELQITCAGPEVEGDTALILVVLCALKNTRLLFLWECLE